MLILYKNHNGSENCVSVVLAKMILSLPPQEGSHSHSGWLCLCV